MTSFATRRRRRRRLAAVAAVIVFAVVAAGFAGLWRRSVEETHRAEAASLIALGQLELERYPTATVAHAIASLERSDSTTARLLALEALWKGPTALVVPDDGAYHSCPFSPDGLSLVKGLGFESSDSEHPTVTVFNADGSSISLVNAHEPSMWIGVSSISDSGHFVTTSNTTDVDSSKKIVLRSVRLQEPLAEITLRSSEGLLGTAIDSHRKRLGILIQDGNQIRVDTLGFNGTREHLGTLGLETGRDETIRRTTVAALAPPAGEWLGVVLENRVFVAEVGDHELGSPRPLGRYNDLLPGVECDPQGRFVVTASEDGSFQFWSLTDHKPPTVENGPPNLIEFYFTPNGSHFWARSQEDVNAIAWVWDTNGDRPRFLRRIDTGGPTRGFWGDFNGRHLATTGPGTSFRYWSVVGLADADPVILNRGETVQANRLRFHPKGNWLATTDNTGLALWPLAKEYPIVIRHHQAKVYGLAFAPDGSWIASSSGDETVGIWPLVGDPPPRGSVLYEPKSGALGIAASPDGQKLVVGVGDGRTALLSVDGSPPRILEGFAHQTWGVSFSLDGRLVAAVGGNFVPEDRVIRIWDVTSGEEVRVLEIGEMPYVNTIQFIQDNRLLASSESGLVLWDVETGEQTLLFDGEITDFATSADGKRALLVKIRGTPSGSRGVVLLDVESGATTNLDPFGDDVRVVVCDSTATIIATADLDGEIRVGRIDGGEPHLLLGSPKASRALAFDPKGRWIASGGHDATIRLWPMPDLSKPPLHTLPREELITKLKTLTNLRVVRDEDSPTGWKLTHDPFPGWETVPTW